MRGKREVDMQSDMVVVGAGLAGLVAANRAAQRGRSVVVLEQGTSEDYLCNSRVASGALNFAHTNPEEESTTLVAAIAADTEGHADPALAAALAAKAGPGLAWLRAEGAELVSRETAGKRSWLMAPTRGADPSLAWEGRGPDLFVRRLSANLRGRGGRIVLSARARQLVMRDGACVGIEAIIAGQREKFEAAAVLLADGGFQNNVDMVGRYISPKPAALVARSSGTAHGDAIRMAEAVGAKLVDMDRFYGHLLSRVALADARFWPYPTLDTLSGAGMLVDRSGRRFADEGLGGILLSNIVAAFDDPQSAIAIFDAAIWDTAGREEANPPNPVLTDVPGALFRADDVAGLARAVGLPVNALTETVGAYNDALATGAWQGQPPRTPGRRFGARRDSPHRVAPRPIERPPFYAAPVAVGLTCTMGGIAIDTSARALGRDRRPIPGLYAAGSTTGGIEGGPAAGYIGGLAKALCLGLIAGEAV
jgi:fumarate reductase flavoprotein subunit